AADPLLVQAGHSALAKGDLAQATRAFLAVEAAEGALREEADFGVALTLALEHDLDAAATRLAGPTQSRSRDLQFWARYNLALIDEARGRLPEGHDGFLGLASEDNLSYVDAARVSRKLGRGELERIE